MLMPESGASIEMNVATNIPATRGVQRVVPLEFENLKTVLIIRNEIRNSAPNATHGPMGPGIVTA